MYTKVDGVSIGSPLLVTFANYYMTHLKNQIFNSEPQLKPTLYCRFVDDDFVNQ